MNRMTAIVLCLLVFACADVSEYGALVIVVGTTASRTVLPDVDFGVVEYRVVATAIDTGESMTASSSGPILEVRHVRPGAWDIAATAYNAAADPILSASRRVVVEPRLEASVALILEPLRGAGILELSVAWPDGGVGDPSVEATLQRSGLSRLETLACGVSSCSGTMDGVSAGYHVLTVQLADGGRHVVGKTEAVRVLAGETTIVSFDFSDRTPLFTGALAVALSTDVQAPPSLAIRGLPPVVYRGETIDVTVEGSLENFAWYLDADPVGQGAEVQFLVPELIGMVDLSVVGTAGTRIGSTSATAAVGEGRGNAGYVFGDVITRAEAPFSSPRSVALAGSTLLVADRARTVAAVVDPNAGTVDETGFRLLSEEDSRFAAAPDAGVVWALGAETVRRYSTDGARLETLSAPLDSFAGAAIAAWADGASASAVGAEGILTVAVDGLLLTVERAELTDEARSLLATADIRSAVATGSELLVADFSGDRILRLQNGDSGYAVLEVLENGVGGVAGLNGASGLLSLGADLYVCSYYDSAVAWFRLDPDAGLYVYRDTLDDVAAGATALSAAVNGAVLFVAAGVGDALVVLERNPETGRVTPAGRFQVPGSLDSPRSVAVASGLAVVASANSGSVEVFREYRHRTVE